MMMIYYPNQALVRPKVNGMYIRLTALKQMFMALDDSQVQNQFQLYRIIVYK